MLQARPLCTLFIALRNVLKTVASRLVVPFGLSSALLAGCITTTAPTPDPALVEKVTEDQRRLAIQMERERLSRLHDLAWPILRANADLCGSRVAPAIGVVLTTIDSFASPMREQVTAEYGIQDKPVVWVLVDGAPAELSGLQVGDEIERVNGHLTGRQELAASMGRLQNTKRGESESGVTLTVNRDGETLEFEIEPETVCETSLHLALTAVVNAWTDGTKITVSSGMMRFVTDDSELQYTIAHELAHIVENHVRKSVGQAVVIAPIEAAAMAWRVLTLGRSRASLMYRFSQAFEREADYIALYMLARAGLQSDGLQEFWNRMAIELPKRIDYGTTHPTSAERYANLSATLEEIRRKIEAGKPLVPERRNPDPES